MRNIRLDGVTGTSGTRPSHGPREADLHKKRANFQGCQLDHDWDRVDAAMEAAGWPRLAPVAPNTPGPNQTITSAENAPERPICGHRGDS